MLNIMPKINFFKRRSPASLTCYRPSGIAPFGGVLATLLGGCAAGVIIGAVYAFLNHHDPLIYLNVLLTIFSGYLLGLIVSKGVRKFHIRNTFAAGVIGAAVFAVAYSVHWFVYLATVLADFETDTPYDIGMIAQIVMELARDPEWAWSVVQEFNSEGVWSISRSGTVVKGVFLSAVWAAEAIVLCFCSVSAPFGAAGEPYSERLGRWMEPEALPAPIAFIENVTDFENAAARGDYSALTAAAPEDEEPQEQGGHWSKYATVILYPDSYEPYVSVKNVSVKMKKKKEDVSTADVVDYLKIPPKVAQDIATALTPGAADA
jgi:hypothetical protein